MAVFAAGRVHGRDRPELIHETGPHPQTFWGLSSVLDVMLWPRKNVGWYLEPGYEVTFHDGGAHHGLGSGRATDWALNQRTCRQRLSPLEVDATLDHVHVSPCVIGSSSRVSR
jgi:hypothetical protein